MRVAIPWRRRRRAPPTSCFRSCDPCGAFGVVDKAIDESDNTTLSTNSQSRESLPPNDNKGDKLETDAITHSSASQTRETFDNCTEADASSPYQNVRSVIEDATLCMLDGVCCRRTCDDNDSTMETCGTFRRNLRKRRTSRTNQNQQFCCTTISWGPGDEEDISVLQDPVIDEYDGGLNRSESESPQPYNISEENLATPIHKNSFRGKNNEKSCAYCGVTRAETNRRMKLCSRCKSTYYCSKECQSEDWYNTHKLTCIPVQN